MDWILCHEKGRAAIIEISTRKDGHNYPHDGVGAIAAHSFDSKGRALGPAFLLPDRLGFTAAIGGLLFSLICGRRRRRHGSTKHLSAEDGLRDLLE